MKPTDKLLPLVLLTASLVSCAPEATDREIEQMCAHLAELRDDSDIETDVKRCIADARKEGISRKQAMCRISAVNASEYWVRCRTGEARSE